VRDFLKKTWLLRQPGNLAWPWVVLFLFLSLAVTHDGGTNPSSRMAAMRAITESHSLNIDSYREWTIDWAQAPNGHYYSNKAPGAVLIGLPFFAVTDLPRLWNSHEPRNSSGLISRPTYFQNLVLLLFTQIIPFSLLVLVASEALMRQCKSPFAVHFFAVCALFGNTAALYMDTYFGHGLASVLFLTCFYLWLTGRYGWSSFFLGTCLLTDYGTVFVLPFFALATLIRERNLLSLVPAGFCFMPALLVWAWYHQLAFGTPFTTANQFTSAAEVVRVSDEHNLWGSVTLLPSGAILWNLLFGAERGVLFFVPWALAVFPGCLLAAPAWPRGSKIFIVGGFCGLLWMNASFGGWNGGLSVGPRYLSFIFPAIAFWLALGWESFPRAAQIPLLVAMIVSFAFRILTFPFQPLAPMEPLWPFFLLMCNMVGWKSLIGFRLTMSLLALLGTLAWIARRSTKTGRHYTNPERQTGGDLGSSYSKPL
jgi:hypothetical protein